MAFFFAYTGYDPAARQGTRCASSVIDVSQVIPVVQELPGVVLAVFLLAFAKDRDENNNSTNGVFRAFWDTNNFSPQKIQAVKDANPQIQFGLSLAGDSLPWQPPADPQSWISNAVSSINGLMQEYGLDYLDIDYESGLDDTFVPIMSSVMRQIPHTQTVAPFGATLSRYLDLQQALKPGVPDFNYQAYAMESKNPQDYITAYQNIKNDPRFVGNLSLGIDTNTDVDQQRGMQYPDITNFFWQNFIGRGGLDLFGSASIWSLEDSCMNGYVVEKTIFGPPP